MARKKQIVDLQARNIRFSLQNEEYKLLCFDPSRMTLDIISVQNKSDGVRNIPFAQLPKEVKKIIKPN